MNTRTWCHRRNGRQRTADPREGEGADEGGRRRRRAAPPPTDHAGREGVPVRGTQRQGLPPRPLRWPPTAVHLQLHVRTDQEVGCDGCSMVVDELSPPGPPACAPTRASRSRRALHSEKLQRYRERVGWQVPGTRGVAAPTASTSGSHQPSRNRANCQDGEMFGLNAFFRDGDDVYRTYFTELARLRAIGPVWSYLDRTLLGRQETWEDSHEGWPQTAPYEWWRRHDEYEGTTERARRIAAAASPAGSTPGSRMRTPQCGLLSGALRLGGRGHDAGRRLGQALHVQGAGPRRGRGRLPPRAGAAGYARALRRRSRGATRIQAGRPTSGSMTLRRPSGEVLDAGGTVLKEPFDALDGGRIAVDLRPRGRRDRDLATAAPTRVRGSINEPSA